MCTKTQLSTYFSKLTRKNLNLNILDLFVNYVIKLKEQREIFTFNIGQRQKSKNN